MGKAACDDYLTHALPGIPTDFSGRLLEVAVGTGILTMPIYQTLPHADITCLDYSPGMMDGRRKSEAAYKETYRVLWLLLCERQLCTDKLVHPAFVSAYEILYATL